MKKLNVSNAINCYELVMKVGIYGKEEFSDTKNKAYSLFRES